MLRFPTDRCCSTWHRTDGTIADRELGTRPSRLAAEATHFRLTCRVFGRARELCRSFVSTDQGLSFNSFKTRHSRLWPSIQQAFSIKPLASRGWLGRFRLAI